MHARVVLGVGKGVLFREVSSVQECPHRERERFTDYCVCAIARCNADRAEAERESSRCIHSSFEAPPIRPNHLQTSGDSHKTHTDTFTDQTSKPDTHAIVHT